MSATSIGIEAAERGFVPDAATRFAIRRLCCARLRGLSRGHTNGNGFADEAFHRSMREGPIALVPNLANEQHYELPSEFFAGILGPRRKYSCCYFPQAATTLAEAEATALALTCQHAELADGQEILELGCGWGSLSVWMAEEYPNSRITAVSNSASQREFIESLARLRGLKNLQVITADMNSFTPGRQIYDRVVSVEMFEHMRNYDRLLERIATWLRPGGKLFVHIFCHRSHAYAFDTEGAANWMGRYFFTGGLMPSVDLLNSFNRSLTVTQQQTWNGSHYQRTADAWLDNLDAHRDDLLPILATAYGSTEAHRWYHRWRLFFLAVSELFGYADGEEWHVGHYLMEPIMGSVRCLH